MVLEGATYGMYYYQRKQECKMMFAKVTNFTRISLTCPLSTIVVKKVTDRIKYLGIFL